jgi:hypothetical protein
MRSARRHWYRIAIVTIVALMLAAGLTATASAATVSPGSGPPPMSEFPELPGLDWSRFGYEWSELYIDGDAHSYHDVTPLTADGAWTIAADATTAPFKTRLRVLKPSNPRCFNGTVYVEWFNVTALQDAAPVLGYAHNEITRQCAAFVGVSAQAAGVNALLSQFPDRYGSAGANLTHPGDSYSYDIFSQAGEAISADASSILGPSFEVERLLAVGQSQSAGRLVTYVNALAEKGIYDGYLIQGRGANGAALRQAPLTPIGTPGPTLIRTDLTQPVLSFQSEAESRLPRQPDSPRFRWWEVAGTAHIDAYSNSVSFNDYGDLAGARLLFDRMVHPFTGPFLIFGHCTFGVNAGGQHWVFQAAVHKLNDWVAKGTPPPTAPRLATSDGTGAGALVLDQHGNATGGIRTPHVDVPIATLRPSGNTPAAGGLNFCGTFGTTTPFSAEKLAQLYRNHWIFALKWNLSTASAVKAGFMLPFDGLLVGLSGATSDVGLPRFPGLGR